MKRKKILLGALSAAVLLGALTIASAIAQHQAVRRQQQALLAAADEVAERGMAEHQARMRRLDQLEKDPAVERSILEGFQISIKAERPSQPQAYKVLLYVHVEHPFGRRHLVDDPGQSCVLYVNGRPSEILRHYQDGDDPRIEMEPSLGSTHPVFRLPRELPKGAMLEVEWINYNPRTGQSERLRSAPCPVR